MKIVPSILRIVAKLVPCRTTGSGTCSIRSSLNYINLLYLPSIPSPLFILVHHKFVAVYVLIKAGQKLKWIKFPSNVKNEMAKAKNKFS